MALISLLTIPLSLMATLLVLYAQDQTINTMMLAGLVIALGAVVDDAIIDVENIVRRLRQHRLSGSGVSTAKVVLDASLEVRSPIVYATLIIVAASVPVFLLRRADRGVLPPLALSYTLAILASLVVALTVTPALCLILLRKAPDRAARVAASSACCSGGYTRRAVRIVRRPRRVVRRLPALLLAARAWRSSRRSGQALLPHFKERDFLMHWVAAAGHVVAEMQRITLAASEDLRAIPGVRNFGAHIGQAFQGDESYGVNFGENWISIDPHVDYDETIAAIEEVVDGLPRPVPGRADLPERADQGGRRRRQRARSSSGSTAPTCTRSANRRQEIEEILGGIDGRRQRAHRPAHRRPADRRRGRPRSGPQKYGLKPGDVRRAAATLVAGEEVGDIFRGGRAYDVVVWSVPGDPRQRRRTSRTCRSTRRPVSGSGWPTWPTVALQPSPERDRPGERVTAPGHPGRRARAWTSAPWGRSSRTGCDAHEFPRGYHVELLGEYEEQQAAQNRGCSPPAAIALALIFLLLQVAFGSWRLAAARPSDAADRAGRRGAGRLHHRRHPLPRVAGRLLHGFGIAARNGILLISHCQHLESEEGETFGGDLVLRGRAERLAPILMTSLATGLALVPLVVLGERPGPGDRAPAGRGHPRRPGHLDAAQPVRRAVALPAVREVAAGNWRRRAATARRAGPTAPKEPEPVPA